MINRSHADSESKELCKKKPYRFWRIIKLTQQNIHLKIFLETKSKVTDFHVHPSCFSGERAGIYKKAMRIVLLSICSASATLNHFEVPLQNCELER